MVEPSPTLKLNTTAKPNFCTKMNYVDKLYTVKKIYVFLQAKFYRIYVLMEEKQTALIL